MDNDEIMQAVVKRAKGYEACETVEEYAMIDGALELVKKRVTVKDVPPDMTAAKLLLDDADFGALTDEQLESEKKRLLSELALEAGQNSASTKSAASAAKESI